MDDEGKKELVRKLLENQLVRMAEAKKSKDSIFLTKNRMASLRQKLTGGRFSDVTDEELAWLESDRERVFREIGTFLPDGLAMMTAIICQGSRAGRVLLSVTLSYEEVGKMLFPVEQLPKAPEPVFFIMDELSADGEDPMATPNGEAGNSGTGDAENESKKSGGIGGETS